MNTYQKALRTIANYLVRHCQPIQNSVENVTITQVADYKFEIYFRNPDYHDYYSEKGDHFEMRCQDDLEFKLKCLVDTLPANYKHKNLYVYGEVGEKGHCYATVMLDLEGELR